jgi:hypothetical protein
MASEETEHGQSEWQRQMKDTLPRVVVGGGFLYILYKGFKYLFGDEVVDGSEDQPTISKSDIQSRIKAWAPLLLREDNATVFTSLVNLASLSAEIIDLPVLRSFAEKMNEYIKTCDRAAHSNRIDTEIMSASEAAGVMRYELSVLQNGFHPYQVEDSVRGVVDVLRDNNELRSRTLNKLQIIVSELDAFIDIKCHNYNMEVHARLQYA